MVAGGRDLFRLGWGGVTKAALDELIDNKIPEGFQLEYKRQLDGGDKVLTAICAMANTFGGDVLIGVDEENRSESQGFGVPGPEGLVGVDQSEKSRLASFCANRLVPPFDPEISAVNIGGSKVVLIVRVDTRIAPRPLTVQNRVMVRTDSGNRPADLFRLRSLFSEAPIGSRIGLVRTNPAADRNPAFFDNDPATMVIQAVASAPLAPDSWRPVLGDEQRNRLRTELRLSELNQWLNRMAFGGNGGNVIHWLDHANSRSDRVELSWSGYAFSQPASPEARFALEIPIAPTTEPSRVDVTIDVVFRPVYPLAGQTPGQANKVSPSDLCYLFRALLALVGDGLPGIINDLVPVDVGPLLGPAIGIRTRSGLTIENLLLLPDGMRLYPRCDALKWRGLAPGRVIESP
jgi:hypothetical protein